MLSKHLTNVIQNLEKKKFRDKYNLFKVEGDKLVSELLLTDIVTETIIAYPEWIEYNKELLKQIQVFEVKEIEMKRISNFKSLPSVIALAKIPEKKFNKFEIKDKLSVVLNGIQDPGNMGTILRVCNWFGIENVFCDQDCASIYNPKTVQAAMGAVFTVNVFYLDIIELIKQYLNDNFPCYGTFLDGENIYSTDLMEKGFIIMGNEGNGIHPDLEKYITHRITIPSFSKGEYSTESLNVGVATGIILSEFKRKEYN